MCPERQIISLYHDEELPSPWKEKLEAHFKTCPECRAVLDGYRNLGESMKELSGSSAGAPGDPDRSSFSFPREETVRAARERVWSKLVALAPVALAPAAQGELPAGRTRTAKRIWSRTVTLPLPAAAAAAAAVIIGVVFITLAGIRGGIRPLERDAMAVIQGDRPYPSDLEWSGAVLGDNYGMVPKLDNMNDVLRYVSNQDNADFMVIRLPESRRFSRSGEPALINAADYSRNSKNSRRHSPR